MQAVHVAVHIKYEVENSALIWLISAWEIGSDFKFSSFWPFFFFSGGWLEDECSTVDHIKGTSLKSEDLLRCKPQVEGYLKEELGQSCTGRVF